MTVSQETTVISVPAAYDLSSYQFHVVLLDAAGNACIQTNIAPTAGSGIVLGILQNKPAAAGRAARVAIGGISKCVAGEAITAAEIVFPTTSGLTLGSSFLGVGTFWPHRIGVAMNAASGSLSVFQVLLK